MPCSDDSRAFALRCRADVVEVQRFVRACASRLGFSTVAAWEVATAASEAATNILKHSHGGTITICADDASRSLGFVAEDCGPGIDNLERAMHDGFSEGLQLGREHSSYGRRGLGAGLAAMQRLMHTFSIESTATGTTVTAKKFSTPPATGR